MAIGPVNAASATSSNWLKEAQESLAAAQNPGGLLGTLQNAASGNPASLRSFLARSQSTSNSLALIAQNTQSSAGALAAQMAHAAAQKRSAERLALAQKLNPVQVNRTPPQGVDPVLYFEDGGSLDTKSNILTMANGTQIDTTTGQQSDRHQIDHQHGERRLSRHQEQHPDHA